MKNINYKNETYTLTEDAYLAGVRGEEYYEAHAKNESGKEILVRWEILPGQEDNEDAGDACNWNEPSEIEELN